MGNYEKQQEVKALLEKMAKQKHLHIYRRENKRNGNIVYLQKPISFSYVKEGRTVHPLDREDSTSEFKFYRVGSNETELKDEFAFVEKMFPVLAGPKEAEIKEQPKDEFAFVEKMFSVLAGPKEAEIKEQPKEELISEGDDLSAISGLGPSITKILNETGVDTFEKLINLGAVEIQMLDDKKPGFAKYYSKKNGFKEQAKKLANAE